MKASLAALLLAACGASWASLGDPASAGPAPGVSATSLRTPAGAAYVRLSRTLASGTMLAEYVDARGIVFAVAWSGPFLPALDTVLGRYYGAFEQNARAVGRSASVNIRQPDVVIASAGRMGAFQGHAWLPTQLPLGFDPRGLQ
jgi:hypothetical protein